MKTRKVDAMRKCDICGKMPKDHYYDMPTAGGAWGNLCEDCKQKQPYTQLGTKFVLRGEKAEPATKELRGIELTSFEDVVMDGDREIGCPNCDEVRSMEPDAGGVFECEGCGSKVRIACLM